MLNGMENTVITAEYVRRRYGPPGGKGFDAVRGVSFSVRRGELFALLGTNGAGKTSLLEVLEGITGPASGVVRVLARDPYRDRRLVRQRIGIMLQEGAFPADLTVLETGRMWGRTLTLPRPVTEVLAMVGLDHRASVPVKQLSGGERRRLDLAMAVLGRPEILFLDEPTAGLDPQSRRRAWGLIRRLLESGTTVVLTTHYLAEAEELADRLAILHRGRIVRTGTPAEVASGQPARISFTLPTGVRERLPNVPGAVGVDVMEGPTGRRVVVRCRDVQSTLPALFAWAGSRGLELGDLNARSASLEEAFLGVAEDTGGHDLDEELTA